MNKVLLAFYHTLMVKSKRYLYKTKTSMKTDISYLDGSERSMIPILKSGFGFNKSDSKKSVIQLEEFSAGTGISDLTVFTLDKRILQKRKSSVIKPLTAKNQIKVLKVLLESETSTLEDIAYKARLTKPTVSKLLDSLRDSQIVFEDKGAYYADYSLKSATTENIIAIEAKVKDWKSGIRQAMRYKEYADFSYLAIYESHVQSSLNNIEIFEKLGIGLIGVSDGGLKIHLEAKKSEETSFENKLLAFERMISTIDNRHETYIARNGFITNSTS